MPPPVMFPCGGSGQPACPPVTAIKTASGETVLIHGATKIEHAPITDPLPQPDDLLSDKEGGK